MVVLRRLINEGKIDPEHERIPPEVLAELRVRKTDFYEALKMVEPSALREVLLEVPNVHWDDVGGLEEVKRELREAVEWPPLKYPKAFQRLGIEPPRGGFFSTVLQERVKRSWPKPSQPRARPTSSASAGPRFSASGR